MNHSCCRLVVFCAGIFISTSVFGQKASPSPTHPDVKSSEKPAGGPASSSACKPVVDVCDVLKQYAALTHFRLIYDNFVQGKISLDVSGLPPEKAIDTIERTLFADGFGIVQVDSDTVEIMGTGKNPRTEGVQIITDPKDLPHGERVVSYLLKLGSHDVQELQQSLGQYLSPPRPYTSFLAFPKSNALLLTERSSVIRKILEIVAAIDVSSTAKTP